MIINCIYDECNEYADIVYIPDLIADIGSVQEKFFKWIFDKDIDHKYWVKAGTEKIACSYGTQAFVDWINDNYLVEHEEKAHIIQENAIEWDARNESLFF